MPPPRTATFCSGDFFASIGFMVLRPFLRWCCIRIEWPAWPWIEIKPVRGKTGTRPSIAAQAIIAALSVLSRPAVHERQTPPPLPWLTLPDKAVGRNTASDNKIRRYMLGIPSAELLHRPLAATGEAGSNSRLQSRKISCRLRTCPVIAQRGDRFFIRVATAVFSPEKEK